MANKTTIGLEIGTSALRYALCVTDDKKTEIRAFGTVPVNEPADASAEPDRNAAIETMAQLMAPYRKMPLDAIGLCVDPLLELSAHKLMPFADPRLLEQTLPQSLSDTWKIDANSQIAFEVGEFVKDPQTHAEDSLKEGGYLIHAVNYPKDVLQAEIARLKAHQIDPHVIMTSLNALALALPELAQVPEQTAWCILDIGANRTELHICRGTEILASRAFKVGGTTIDGAIAQAFDMPIGDARKMKENTAFLAAPGTEFQVYEALLQNHQIQPRDVDAAKLAAVTAQAVSVLLSGIRQMIMQNVRKHRIDPTQICLIGGGSKLIGLDAWLSQSFGVACRRGFPLKPEALAGQTPDAAASLSIGAAAAAVCAQKNIDGKCPLNLRRGELAHKGSLAVIQEKKWILAALAVLVLIALIAMTATKSKAVQTEHDRLRAALETATLDVFGKKLLSYAQIEREIADSRGYAFIPDRTAFTHFAWISSQVNDNLSDVDMDLNSLDIDTQRKIVTFRGEVSGDEGLPKFMQLLEQYECFPNEIQEPKTSKSKDRVSFTLRVEATQCASGGDGE